MEDMVAATDRPNCEQLSVRDWLPILDTEGSSLIKRKKLSQAL